MPVRIVVDERERKSSIPDLLRQAGTTIDFAHLKVGDYVVSPETAVERKTIHDLLNSIYDGRLFVQCSQLNEYYMKPALIVEGNIVDFIDIPKQQKELVEGPDIIGEGKEECNDVRTGLQRERERKELQGNDTADLGFERITCRRESTKILVEKIPLIYDALVKVALDFRIPVIHTPSASYTSKLLVIMVHKTLQNGGTTGPLLKRIKKDNSRYLQQLSILSSLPGVGDKLAVRMLERFQTPIRALNASAAELARISGFGTERAARIRRILDDSIHQKNPFPNQFSEDNKRFEKRSEVIQRTLFDQLTDS